MPKVNCLACRHFFITYRPDHPYGCRALGFKSKELPSRVVLASSGLNCQAFTSKNKDGKQRESPP